MFHPSPMKFIKSTRNLKGTKAKLIMFAIGQSFQQTSIVPHSPSFTKDPAFLPAPNGPVPAVMAVKKGTRKMMLSVRGGAHWRRWGGGIVRVEERCRPKLNQHDE